MVSPAYSYAPSSPISQHIGSLSPPVLSGVTCVGGRGHSQTRCLPSTHRWGHSQTGVYLIFPSPKGRTHRGVMWPLSGLWCQACGAASMGCGQGRISQGGSARCTGAGRAGLASFAIGVPLQEGPYSTMREAGQSERWIHRSTTLGIWGVQASSVMETGSLWNFSWEREIALASAFVPC